MPCSTDPLTPSVSIIWQDADLLVVNKPSGLLTVPGRGPDKQDCLINRLLVDYPNSRIVHRLDQPTSGLVLVPQNHHAHKTLGKQFEQRQISKRYLAVVGGLLEQDQGDIELPLICDWPNRPRQMVDFANGKHALTRYRVIARDNEKRRTRVALTPVTGRSHQLRVHMQALGHPILGDNFYATQTLRDASERLLLHAEWISFAHPVTGDTVSLECPSEF
ncbi:RluA family pseudouridine synthase [Gilvimarinus sp. SDUM040013]|uniref:Pseudouridine synthase n=1 Tax=Gilvimarinus gilvus TaxID=3058038 RepID=A0ABU4RY43_9GAMM|nr:RluA family pseudouridine synthase [Gilvimarinus sp. SDUM040013]MDO3386580.1 RluA family pseudouridine synthase [Gilvimarinus sp. SDUM040013]MDX6849156.1 RluA family pseudouridine synthase [Gilvimarinus sp. SDUM040013]